MKKLLLCFLLLTSVAFADSGMNLSAGKAQFATPTASVDGVNLGHLTENYLTLQASSTYYFFTTRDFTAASGDVSYTGVPFSPRAGIIMCSLPGGNNSASIGFFHKGTTGSCIYNNGSVTATDWSYSSSVVVQCMYSNGNLQTAVIKSCDANGLTLTWTKGGSPTGTAGVIAIFFR